MLSARLSPPESPSWAPFLGADPLQIPIDSNGNLNTKIEGSDTWTYTWNAENQLTKVEKNAVEQARFSYDAIGRRVEKIAGGITTAWTYDNDAILRQVRGGSTSSYVQGPGIDEPLAVDDGSALSYFHADGLGSIAKMTGSAGAVTLTRQYDVWGKLEVGASEPGYAFTGREWDPEIGQYAYRARYYEPISARFTSEDPTKWTGGMNFYAYVDGEPVGTRDPYGLKGCKVPANAAYYACCKCGKESICRGPNWNTAKSPNVRKCMIEHEYVHRDDFSGRCQGQPDGPLCVDQATWFASDCRAWRLTFECLSRTAPPNNAEETSWFKHAQKRINYYCF